MTIQKYLNSLYELKQFLHDNPKLYKIYSDINVDEQIIYYKNLIWRENDANENSILSDEIGEHIDEFVDCNYSPFL